MKTKVDLINIAKRYSEAQKDSEERHKGWVDNGKLNLVKSTLELIANDLKNNVEYFSSNIYVNEFEAPFGRKGIIFKVGKSPIAKNLTDNGFQIQFFPTLNNKIIIIAYGHSLNEDEPKVKELALVEFMSSITQEFIVGKVWEGISYAQETNFLFD